MWTASAPSTASDGEPRSRRGKASWGRGAGVEESVEFMKDSAMQRLIHFLITKKYIGIACQSLVDLRWSQMSAFPCSCWESSIWGTTEINKSSLFSSLSSPRSLSLSLYLLLLHIHTHTLSLSIPPSLPQSTPSRSLSFSLSLSSSLLADACTCSVLSDPWEPSGRPPWPSVPSGSAVAIAMLWSSSEGPRCIAAADKTVS